MGTIPQQSSLAEKITLSKDGDEFWFGGGFCVVQDLRLAFFDDTENLSHLSVSLNKIAWAIVSMIEALSPIGVKEAEVSREENVPRPIQSDFHPAGPRWQFQQVDTGPQKPGEETGDAYPKHFCNRLVATNGAELPKSFKAKGLGGLAFQHSNEVHRRLAALPFSKLTCRR